MKIKANLSLLLAVLASYASAAPAAAQCHLPTYLAAIDIPLTPEGLERCAGTTSRLLDYVYASEERLYVRARAVASLGYLEDPRTSTALRGIVVSELDVRLRSQAVITLARTHLPDEQPAITLFLGERVHEASSLLRATIFRELERMSLGGVRPLPQ